MGHLNISMQYLMHLALKEYKIKMKAITWSGNIDGGDILIYQKLKYYHKRMIQMNVVNKLKPSHIKAFIKSKQYKYSLDKQYKIYKNKKKFVLIGTPEHGNLGDYAITIAQYSILKENFNEYDFVELTLNEYFEKIEFIKKYIDKEDVIIINGGGILEISICLMKI